jgi:cell wall-associated NlpC family hydrolase
MTIADFFDTYQNSMLNRKLVNPLSSSNVKVTTPKLGIDSPNRQISTIPSYGSSVPDWLDARKSGALSRYMESKSGTTTSLAQDYTKKAAGQIATDEYGIVQDKTSDFSDYFNKNLGAIRDRGKSALATAEAQAQWQSLQDQAELNAGYRVNWAPGASSNNPGAKAVSLAMTAFQNKVPYVWGGNSLSKGVDCSGLVQQAYRQLGISIPRTTYDQAKSGRRVSLNNLLPGDLVFYNSGSSDPNGIGVNGHVAIYIGNGQIIDARNSRAGIKMGSINIMGGPTGAVRPW